MKKTNAIRLLDQHRVSYEVIPYTYHADKLSVADIAKENDLPVNSVYKTLVLKGDKNGVFVAMVPGDQQLHFKAIAKLSGNKKVTTVPVKDLLGLTGYVRGGCTPLGMKKEYPVYADEAIMELESVLVNAGKRGLLIQLNPAQLIQVTKAVIGQITTEE